MDHLKIDRARLHHCKKCLILSWCYGLYSCESANLRFCANCDIAQTALPIKNLIPQTPLALCNNCTPLLHGACLKCLKKFYDMCVYCILLIICICVLQCLCVKNITRFVCLVLSVLYDTMIHIITHSGSLYHQCLSNPTEVCEQNLEGNPVVKTKNLFHSYYAEK